MTPPDAFDDSYEPSCPGALRVIEKRRSTRLKPDAWETFCDRDGAPEEFEEGLIFDAQLVDRFDKFCEGMGIDHPGNRIERKPPIEALRARTQALSEFAAAAARRSSEVEEFREDYLSMYHPDFKAALKSGVDTGFGGDYLGPTYLPWEPLALDDVEAWLIDKYNRDAPDGDGERHLREAVYRGYESRDLAFYVPMEEETPEGVPLFARRKVSVLARSCLGELAKLADKLAEDWEWDEAEATMFVLTDEEPLVSPATMSSRISGGTTWEKCRMTIVVDPVVSPEELAKWYRDARRNRLPQDYRPQRTEKHIVLGGFWAVRGVADRPDRTEWAAFLREWSESNPDTRPDPRAEWDRLHPGPPWTAYMAEWNRLYPEWTYTNWRHFARDAAKARKRLLFPPYKWD